MPADRDPRFAHVESNQIVELECHDGCASARRQPDDLSPVGAPFEMIVPALRSRVEQGRKDACFRIRALILIALEPVA